MAQPPVAPTFEKAKYTGDSGPSFSRFWALIQSFFKTTAAALNRGISVSENMAAGWVEIELPPSPTYPLTATNPLPNRAPARGALVAWVEDAANPGKVCSTAGVFAEVGNAGGGLVIRNVTGLASGRAFTLRLLVFA